MPRVSAAFFAAASVCLLLGMSWGIQMGATENFTMMPAHAHLNLLGWVTMALYGTFYALTPNTLSPRLAWINFTLSLLGVVLMIPFLALFLAQPRHRLTCRRHGGGRDRHGARACWYSAYRWDANFCARAPKATGGG